MTKFAIVVAALVAPLCLLGAADHAAARNRTARPVPVRARHRSAAAARVDERPHLLPADRRRLPAESRSGRTPSSGVGDSYLGEDTAASVVLAANEFREFLQFYPDQPARRLRAVQAGDEPLRADARAPSAIRPKRARRSRSSTCSSSSFPNSPLTPEVKKNWRIARDRLSESSYGVGLHYYRSPLVSGRHRPLPRSAPRRPRLHRPGLRLLLSGGVAGQNR